MNPAYDYNDFSGLTGEISTDIANRPYVNGNSGMPTYASNGVTYPELSGGMILLSHVNSGNDGVITEFRFARTHSQSSKPKYYGTGSNTNVFNTEVKFKTAMNSYPGDNANYVFKMELWGDNDRDSWLQITPSPLNGNKLHVDIAELVSDPSGDYGYGVGKGNWADGPFSGRTWRVCNKNTKVRSSDANDNWLEESAILADAATNNTTELALEWGTEYCLAISAVFSDAVDGDVITYTFKDAARHSLTSVSVGSWGDYYQVGDRTYVDSLGIQVRHEGDPSGPYKQPVLYAKSIAYGSSDEIVNLSTIEGITIDLAGGNDKVVYNIASTAATITFPTSNSCQVQLKNTEAPESDLLVNVELIQFSDKTIVVADARAGNNSITVDGSNKVIINTTTITTADAGVAAAISAFSAAAAVSGGSATDAATTVATAANELAETNPAAYAAMIATMQEEIGGTEIVLSPTQITDLFGDADVPAVVTLTVANADNTVTLPSNPASGFYCQFVPDRSYTLSDRYETASVTVVYDAADKSITVDGTTKLFKGDTLTIGNQSSVIADIKSLLLYTGRNVACFTAGMRILTPTGYRAVETLRKGDLVMTADGREAPIKVYSSHLKTTTAATAPYVVPAHSFGRNTPPAELRLSPLHAFQTKKNIWQLPKYANNAKVVQYGVGEPVTYYHLECPNFFRDNLVAEGCVVESFGAKQTAGIKTIYTPNTRLGGYTRITGPTAAAAHTSR